MREERLGEGSNTAFQLTQLDPKELLKLNREEKRYFQEFALKVAMGDSHLYKAFLSIISDVNVRKILRETSQISEAAKYISEKYSVSFYEVANFMERFLEKLSEFRRESEAKPREIYMGIGIISLDNLFRLGKEGAEEILSLADEFDAMRALQILNEKNAQIIYILAAFHGEVEVMREAFQKIKLEELEQPFNYIISFLHRLLLNEDPGIEVKVEAKDDLSKVWKALSLIFDSLKEAKRELEKVSLEGLFGIGPWAYALGRGVQFLVRYMEGNLHEIAEEMKSILEEPSLTVPTPKSLLMIMLLNTMAEISEQSKLEEKAREFLEVLEECRNCPLRSLMGATIYHLKAKGATRLSPPSWFLYKKIPGIEVIGEIKREESALSSGESIELKEIRSVFPYFSLLQEYCKALKLCCDKKFKEGEVKLEEVIRKLEERGYLKKATEAKMMLVKCLVEEAKLEKLDKGKLLRKAERILEEVRIMLEKMKKQKMLNEVEDYREMIEHLLRIWEMSHR